METDTKRILLQVLQTMLEEVEVIEALDSRLAQLSGGEAAQAGCARGLADRVERLAEQVRHHC